ncbi:MAG: hypothetical protein ORO03_08820, partial [Alphaproteobacteria bacterium]|nr:hypothetical protein [Alphaproteobacteria bacterium]
LKTSTTGGINLTHSGTLATTGTSRGIWVKSSSVVFAEGTGAVSLTNRTTNRTDNGGQILIEGNIIAKGALTVEQDAGSSGATGIVLTSTATTGSLIADGNILLRQSGNAGTAAIYINKTAGVNDTIWSKNGTITIEQTANSSVRNIGIFIIESYLKARGDLSITQLGTVTQTATIENDIKYTGVSLGTVDRAGGPVTLGNLGLTSQFGTITIKTMNLPLTFAKTNNFTITASRLIFDLGTGAALYWNNTSLSSTNQFDYSLPKVQLKVGDFLFRGGEDFDIVPVSASPTITTKKGLIDFDLNGGNFYRAKFEDGGGAGATINSSTAAVSTFAPRPKGMRIYNSNTVFGTEFTVDSMPGGNPTSGFVPTAIANSPLGGTAVIYINNGAAGLTIDSSRVTSLGVNYIGANKITVNSGAAAVYNFTNGVKLAASDQIVLDTTIGNSASPTDISDLWLQAGAGGIVSGQGTVSISASTLHLDTGLSASAIELNQDAVGGKSISGVNATNLFLHGTANSTYNLTGNSNAIAGIRLGTSGLGTIAVTSSVSTTIVTENKSTLGGNLAVTVNGTGNSLTLSSINLNNKNLSLTATGNIILGNIFETTGDNGVAVGTNSQSTLSVTSSAGSVSQTLPVQGQPVPKIIVGTVKGGSYENFTLGNAENQIAEVGNITVTGVTPKLSDQAMTSYSVITVFSKSSLTVSESATLQTNGGTIILSNRFVPPTGVSNYNLTILGTLRVNNQALLPTAIQDQPDRFTGRINLQSIGVISNKDPTGTTYLGRFDAQGYAINAADHFDIKLAGAQNLRGILRGDGNNSTFVAGGDLTITNDLSLIFGTNVNQSVTITLKSATGSITQTAGQIRQTRSVNALILAASGEIKLTQKGNQLTSLGTITAGGDIEIHNYLNVLEQ